MATATDNVSRLRTAIADWNAGHLDRYLGLYDDGIRLHGYTPEPMDKVAVRAFYEAIWQSFPRPQIALYEVLADGDFIAARFAMTGTHRGQFLDIPATGRDIVLPGITILRFRDGRCIERWSCADIFGLLVQLGKLRMPAPPPG